MAEEMAYRRHDDTHAGDCMSFLTERDSFERQRSDLLHRHGGGYAVLDGSNLVGVYATLTDATSGGLQTLRRSHFFVGRITPARERVTLRGMTGLL